MFLYRRVIRMRDTDATGAIYFSAQLEIGLEVFEAYTSSKQFHLQEMLTKGEFLLPIVHAEADFFKPITLGQELKVKWQVTSVGVRSFTHRSSFLFKGEEMGRAVIIHAAVAKKTGQAITLPKELAPLLGRCDGYTDHD